MHIASQNGKSERKFYSIKNIIRTLLCHASLLPSLWPHALNTDTYYLNILPSKLLGNLTLTRLLYHETPSYHHVWVFGCLCFRLISSTTIHKLLPHSSPCVFFGYPSSHRDYKCYDLSTHKIVISCHVLFDEATIPFSRSSPCFSMDYQFLSS